MFEGPLEGCVIAVAVVVAGFTKFGGGIRRLRVLAREMLLVEEDMLYPDRLSSTTVAL